MAQAAVMDERGTPTQQPDEQDAQAIRVARRLAAEFSLLVCQRLREGDSKEASTLAEWQRYMEQIADGADVGTIPLPVHRPARPV